MDGVNGVIFKRRWKSHWKPERSLFIISQGRTNQLKSNVKHTPLNLTLSNWYWYLRPLSHMTKMELSIGICSTPSYTVLPYSTLPYPTLPCSTLPYPALSCPTLPYYMLQMNSNFNPLGNPVRGNDQPPRQDRDESPFSHERTNDKISRVSSV